VARCQVAERGNRICEEHDPEARDHHVERNVVEGVDLDVGLLESGVGHPAVLGVGARPFQHRRRQIHTEDSPGSHGGGGRQ